MYPISVGLVTDYFSCQPSGNEDPPYSVAELHIIYPQMELTKGIHTLDKAIFAPLMRFHIKHESTKVANYFFLYSS